jgi:hypothetical protein
MTHVTLSRRAERATLPKVPGPFRAEPFRRKSPTTGRNDFAFWERQNEEASDETEHLQYQCRAGRLSGGINRGCSTERSSF